MESLQPNMQQLTEKLHELTVMEYENILLSFKSVNPLTKGGYSQFN